MQKHYTRISKWEGLAVLLLVEPSVFAHYAKTTKYHLYAEGGVNIIKVPVIYVEGGTLFVHESWPFKLSELPEEARDYTRVVALSASELQKLVQIGYTKYAAAKIIGE